MSQQKRRSEAVLRSPSWPQRTGIRRGLPVLLARIWHEPASGRAMAQSSRVRPERRREAPQQAQGRFPSRPESSGHLGLSCKKPAQRTMQFAIGDTSAGGVRRGRRAGDGGDRRGAACWARRHVEAPGPIHVTCLTLTSCAVALGCGATSRRSELVTTNRIKSRGRDER